MNNHDNTENSVFEKQLQDTYQEQSTDKTSSQLDDAILAMAQDHLVDSESIKGGFWHHFFNSKKMKYGFSLATALFVTVGIARFMVYLGQTDQSMAQNDTAYSAQEVAANSVAFEMAAESRELSKRVAQQKRSIPNLVTKPEMKEILADSPTIAAVEEAQSIEKVVVTGSRVKRVGVESASPVTNEVSEAAPVAKAEGEYSSGVLDEAVSGYPLPEVWLEEIVELLQSGDQIQALEEWQQLENTYPEFEIPAETLSKLQALKKIGQKSD